MEEADSSTSTYAARSDAYATFDRNNTTPDDKCFNCDLDDTKPNQLTLEFNRYQINNGKHLYAKNSDYLNIKNTDCSNLTVSLSPAVIQPGAWTLKPGQSQPLGQLFTPSGVDKVNVVANHAEGQIEISSSGHQHCEADENDGIKTVKVFIQDNCTFPETITINVGDFVVFENESTLYTAKVLADPKMDRVKMDRVGTASPGTIEPGKHSRPFQFKASSDASGYHGGLPYQVTLVGVALAVSPNQLLPPVFPLVAGPFTGTIEVLPRKEKSPVVKEVCREIKEIEDELKSIQTGWFCVGRKRDVPKDACFVGHYGDTYTWVGPNGREGLTRFTLSVLKLSDTIKERQVITAPGVQYSPALALSPR